MALLLLSSAANAQTNNPGVPTWWAKYQTLVKNGVGSGGGGTSSLAVGATVDASNE